MKRLVKRILANAMYWSGFLHLYKHVRLREKALVLMYHRILPTSQRRESFSNDGIIVETDTFDRHLALLKRHFRLVSVDELAQGLQQGKAFKNFPCLISFDDGWSDNYEHALPLLKKHQAPAVIFLPTDYIGTGRLFWQERLGHLIYGVYRQQDRIDAELIRRLGLQDVLKLPEPTFRQGIKAFVNRQKSRPYSEIDTLVGELSEVVDQHALPQGVDRYFDWERAREMLRHGISLGAHAVTHRILTRLTPQEVQYEAAESKRRLEQELGQPVISFAYPNGDFDTEVATMVQAQGFAVAFSTQRGFVAAGDRPHAIKRINVHNDATDSPALFLSRILGLL